MDVDTGYRYKEKFRGGLQWYMSDSKDFTSSINFIIKNGSKKLVSFNGQSFNFCLPIKKILIYT